MNKTYEDTLPNDYKEILVIDGNNTKYLIIFNGLCIIITLFLIIIIFKTFRIKFSDIDFLYQLIYFVCLILYCIVHELVHGIVYKIMTKKKLKFGFNGIYACCGLPNTFVYRKTAILSLIAPFIVLSIILIIFAMLISNPIYKFLSLLIFALHVGGCSGDLYTFALFVFKYKDPDILMIDEGMKQILYSNK